MEVVAPESFGGVEQGQMVFAGFEAAHAEDQGAAGPCVGGLGRCGLDGGAGRLGGGGLGGEGAFDDGGAGQALGGQGGPEAGELGGGAAADAGDAAGVFEDAEVAGEALGVDRRGPGRR